MDGPRNYINELSQTVKDKRHITYIRNLKNGQTELLCRTDTDLTYFEKLMVSK